MSYAFNRIVSTAIAVSTLVGMYDSDESMVAWQLRNEPTEHEWMVKHGD